jgi:hypothetical protein
MRWLIELAVLLAILLGAAHVIDVAYGMQPLPLNQEPCNSVELVASLEDGDVNVYLVTHCNYFKGTTTVASRDRCYVTVGELHGKTVSTICKFGGRK